MPEKSVSRREFLRQGFKDNPWFNESKRKSYITTGLTAGASIHSWKDFASGDSSVSQSLKLSALESVFIAGFFIATQSAQENTSTRKEAVAYCYKAAVAGISSSVIANATIASLAFHEKKT